ncbi:hypothetical protein ACOMHN_053101 [Nucella lapillus]
MPLPPIVGERTGNNLRKLLMPSRAPTLRTTLDTPGCHRCKAKRCVVCLVHLEETTSFQSVRTGQTFTIRDSLDCKSTNVVYLIDCRQCVQVQYVGETGLTVMRRFHAHRSSIIRKSSQSSLTSQTGDKRVKTLVAKHFQSARHTLQHLQVTVIEQVKPTVGDVTIHVRGERFSGQ